jgi:hypothetical protein
MKQKIDAVKQYVEDNKEDYPLFRSMLDINYVRVIQEIEEMIDEEVEDIADAIEETGSLDLFKRNERLDTDEDPVDDITETDETDTDSNIVDYILLLVMVIAIILYVTQDI